MTLVRQPPQPIYPDPFDYIGVRELSRATGLDKAYLSRIKTNKIPIDRELLIELWRVIDEAQQRQKLAQIKEGL